METIKFPIKPRFFFGNISQKTRLRDFSRSQKVARTLRGCWKSIRKAQIYIQVERVVVKLSPQAKTIKKCSTSEEYLRQTTLLQVLRKPNFRKSSATNTCEKFVQSRNKHRNPLLYTLLNLFSIQVMTIILRHSERANNCVELTQLIS